MLMSGPQAFGETRVGLLQEGRFFTCHPCFSFKPSLMQLSSPHSDNTLYIKQGAIRTRMHMVIHNFVMTAPSHPPLRHRSRPCRRLANSR